MNIVDIPASEFADKFAEQVRIDPKDFRIAELENIVDLLSDFIVQAIWSYDVDVAKTRTAHLGDCLENLFEDKVHVDVVNDLFKEARKTD